MPYNSKIRGEKRPARKYEKVAALWPKTRPSDGATYYGGGGSGILAGRYIILKPVTVQYANGPEYEILASEPEEAPHDE